MGKRKAYTITKAVDGKGNKFNEFVVMESKWRSYARIQKIPKGTCLICVVFDEMKVEQMIQAYQSQTDALPRLPSKIYPNETSFSSVVDFVDPILNYLCSVSKTHRLFGVIGPCTNSQYTRVMVALASLQEMPFFQSLAKVSKVNNIAYLGEITENYAFPIQASVIPLCAPFQSSAVSLFYSPPHIRSTDTTDTTDSTNATETANAQS